MKPFMSFTAMSLGMALFSQGLAAQDTSAEGEVTIVGRVADRCLFTVPSKVIDLGELSLPGTDASAGRIDASKVNGANETLEGWCNGTAATMTVEAFPIENVSFAASAPSGFDRVINYTATATATANAVDGTDSSVTSGAGSAVAVGMFTGPIPVALSGASTPTGGILVSGDYQGLVRVTLAPNVSFGQPE